ncbi:hypothetical protein KQ51_01347 [Candidatus Izimaplasma bacterium HR1]|jgi:hypothetical protein|uniref:YcxB family protein n=1 Tax=Candidatus Izimoplasma sp. HR1 TaxID=1541959 RepID=UPI0004F858F1|nr:hypothetical protein KQ51_01347 [Candidatus Izimaplasma bacterium HR1]
MDYKFKQDVSKDDYVSFVTNHMKQSFIKPLNVILFTVSIGYLMISPFLMAAEDRNYTFTFIGVGLMLLLVALVIFSKKAAERQYDKSEGGFSMEYEITDDALIYIVNEGNISKQWYEFYSVNENEDYLYVYVNKQRGMLIIKSALSGDALRFIKDKLRANIKPRKVKLID